MTLDLVDQNNGNCISDANVTVIASGGNGSLYLCIRRRWHRTCYGRLCTSNYKELDPSVNTDWDVYVLDGNGCTAPPLDITIIEMIQPRLFLELLSINVLLKKVTS